MPISGPSSYLPTCEAFLAHWAEVNTALPPAAPLIINGAPLGQPAAITIALFSGYYDALLAQHAAVQTAIVEADLASADLTDRKTLLHDKLLQFNEKVRALLPGTKWERLLPLVPGVGDGRAVFTEPVETARNLWTRLDADAALPAGVPLTLLDGYNLADYIADLDPLSGAFRTVVELDNALALEREERNDMQDRIYPILKQYRLLMPTLFPAGNALIDSLPLLTPTGSRTPDPVVATAVWDAPAEAAKLTWTESTDPDLDHYDIRWSPGTEYHIDEESTLGTVTPAAAREFHTAQGLPEPGAKSFYRVVVVLTTGHEAGSDPVAVVRG